MNNEKAIKIGPKLLTVIVDRNNTINLEGILREKHLNFHYMFNAMGTASSDILKSLGLSGTEKTVCICMVPGAVALSIMTSVADRLQLTNSGNGITFFMPISGISTSVSNIFSEDMVKINEELEKYMDAGTEEIKEDANYAMVLSVVNNGFSDTLMEAARSVGARGGTIIHARRTGIEEHVKFFGISLQAEKEIVAILVPRSQKKDLMLAISKKCGINTEAHGIMISLPVECCSGISISDQEKNV